METVSVMRHWSCPPASHLFISYTVISFFAWIKSFKLLITSWRKHTFCIRWSYEVAFGRPLFQIWNCSASRLSLLPITLVFLKYVSLFFKYDGCFKQEVAVVSLSMNGACPVCLICNCSCCIIRGNASFKRFYRSVSTFRTICFVNWIQLTNSYVSCDNNVWD
jgi:hypothetical protein